MSFVCQSYAGFSMSETNVQRQWPDDASFARYWATKTMNSQSVETPEDLEKLEEELGVDREHMPELEALLTSVALQLAPTTRVPVLDPRAPKPTPSLQAIGQMFRRKEGDLRIDPRSPWAMQLRERRLENLLNDVKDSYRQSGKINQELLRHNTLARKLAPDLYTKIEDAALKAGVAPDEMLRRVLDPKFKDPSLTPLREGMAALVEMPEMAESRKALHTLVMEQNSRTHVIGGQVAALSPEMDVAGLEKMQELLKGKLGGQFANLPKLEAGAPGEQGVLDSMKDGFAQIAEQVRIFMDQLMASLSKVLRK